MINKIDKVSIKFKAGAYGAYRSMNNKIWYALAEYIDNALQSYLSRKEEILRIEKDDYQFTVYLDININDDYIRISDNAGGIDYANFIRAFEPANIPLDSTGLSEFGMGMKIASIWLADFYSVRSSAIGEKFERSVSFDLNRVMSEEKEELNVKNLLSNENQHFTEILLKKLSHNAPKRVGGQINRIKNHLTSIYRKFLKTKEMKLVFNGEELYYDEPAILVAPFVDNLEGEPVEWKKDIEFEFEEFKVKGFIGLLAEMKKNHCGISLFRRGRVIQGSHDEKYHPTIICGQAGSPRDKRLFGELELEGFKVSFDKGRFTQVDELEEILGLVKRELNSPNFNLLKQGDRYRKPIKKKEKLQIINKTLKEEKQRSFNEEYRKKRNKTFAELQIKPKEVISKRKVEIKEENKLDKIQINFPWNNENYQLEIEYINESGLELCELYESEGLYKWKGRINLSHKFFDNYKIINSDSLKPVLAIFKGLLLSEAISISQGTKMGGYIRQNLNKLLKTI